MREEKPLIPLNQLKGFTERENTNVTGCFQNKKLEMLIKDRLTILQTL